MAALLCVLYQVAAPWHYAEAQPAAERSGTRATFAMPEIGGRLDEAVRRTRESLARLDATSEQALAGSPGLREAAGRCETAFQAIEVIDREILDRYERAADHIRETGLGAEIRARNDAAEKSYRGRFQDLRQAVRETIRLARQQQRESERGNHARATARRAEVAELAARADDFLVAMVARPERVPLDPENLPHRLVEQEPRDPRLTPEEFDELSVANEDAAAESAPRVTAPVLSFAAAAAAPAPEDLAETVEVRFTPEIEALAEELGGDPLAIFDFVHNEIEFTPTFGSIQGANSCLLSRRCSAFDTASLLIALYRASGIPARYAMGTIEVPIDEVKGLAGGFTDVRAALQLIASSGTPVAAVSSEGEMVAAQLEHVWVEAFLDYIPSRGTRHVEGDTWVPLDPSFKQARFVEPFDVLGALDFDAEGFLTSILDTVQIDEMTGAIEGLDVESVDEGMADLERQIDALAESPASPETAREILGGLEVDAAKLRALPGAPPYRVLVRAGQFAEVPASLRHRLRFEVASGLLGLTSDLVHTAPLPALAGKRITLSYVPATEDDAATLASFLPEGDISITDLPSSFPAYLIEMRPELKVEGEVVATGRAVTLGLTGRFRLFFDGPGAAGRTITNAITAGSYSALVLNLGRIESPEPRRQRILSVVAELQSEDPSGVDRDDVFGELLHLAGVLYWLEREVAERAAAGVHRVAFRRLLSEGIFAFGLRVESLFGAPVRVSSDGLITDIGANVFTAASLNGDPQRPVDFAVATGVIGSRKESAIWDVLLDGSVTGQGVDSMSYLEAAASRGIPIFGIDAENLSTALPQLQVSGAVKRDIENAVNAGRVVTIPQRAFELNDFSGIGFVALDTASGSGAYMISRGLAGGGVFSVDNEFKLFFDVALNVSLTLSAKLVPVLATPVLLLVIAGFMLSVVISLIKAIEKVRGDTKLTKEQKAAIFLNWAVQFILLSLLTFVGIQKFVKFKYKLAIAFTGPLADYAGSVIVGDEAFAAGTAAKPPLSSLLGGSGVSGLMGALLAMEMSR